MIEQLMKFSNYVFGNQVNKRFKRILITLITIGLLIGLLFCLDLGFWKPAGTINIEVNGGSGNVYPNE